MYSVICNVNGRPRVITGLSESEKVKTIDSLTFVALFGSIEVSNVTIHKTL